MTPEQLLQPRYEVIADYPNSPFNSGEILELRQYELMNGHKYYGHERANAGGVWDENYLNKYPHLFRKLEWWEKRKPEDMPEYVKLNPENTIGGIEIFKIEKWFDDAKWFDRNCFYTIINNSTLYAIHLIPATETDYQNYLNQNQVT